MSRSVRIDEGELPGYADEAWSSRDSLMGEKANEGLIFRDSQPRKRTLWPVCLHVLLVALYSIIFGIITFGRGSSSCVPDFTNSPAIDAVRYKKVPFNGTLATDNVYKGEPRPELDEAWSKLIRNLNIRLSSEELGALNRDAIELSDRSGFHGELSVYHHIHCLKFIRQVIYDDYYHIDPDGRTEHVDHCIDDIRQALLCNADLSVVTMEWKPHYRRPWPNFNVDHTCVDWEALDEWASRRSFSIFDQKSLVHPEMGLLFPLIDGEYETVAGGPDIHIVWPEGFAPIEALVSAT